MPKKLLTWFIFNLVTQDYGRLLLGFDGCEAEVKDCGVEFK